MMKYRCCLNFVILSEAKNLLSRFFVRQESWRTQNDGVRLKSCGTMRTGNH